MTTLALPADATNLVRSYLLKLQNNICATLENLDGVGLFVSDKWERPTGGGGDTRILANGQVFAKAGVNFSEVFGDRLPPAASANRPLLSGAAFRALGVSVVIHPTNPYVPTAHANIRFFVAERDGNCEWWFGGGFDLTPYYGFHEDCIHWHQMAKLACDPYGKHIYSAFKAWCDRYFYLKHRNEPRGIGGLFFDDFNEGGFAHSFALTKNIGDHFIKAYAPIVQRRKEHCYTEQEKAFQSYRRGRYVEFNLIYDRGTLFGLQSKGRTESILMSLPPEASWTYNWHPDKDSPETKLYTEFLRPQEWIL